MRTHFNITESPGDDWRTFEKLLAEGWRKPEMCYIFCTEKQRSKIQVKAQQLDPFSMLHFFFLVTMAFAVLVSHVVCCTVSQCCTIVTSQPWLAPLHLAAGVIMYIRPKLVKCRRAP